MCGLYLHRLEMYVVDADGCAAVVGEASSLTHYNRRNLMVKSICSALATVLALLVLALLAVAATRMDSRAWFAVAVMFFAVVLLLATSTETCYSEDDRSILSLLWHGKDPADTGYVSID